MDLVRIHVLDLTNCQRLPFWYSMQNSSDSVQSHLIPELPADPKLTLQSTAVVDNDQFPPKPPSYSSLFPASHSVLFEHPQFGLPIIKHIPKSVRPSCNTYLSTLLSKLCASPDNISLWKAFLNFAPSFPFKPQELKNVKICRQSSRNGSGMRKVRNYQ